MPPEPRYLRGASAWERTDDPFREYHRGRRREAAVRFSVIGVGVAGGVAAAVWLATLAPTTAAAVSTAPAATPTTIAAMSPTDDTSSPTPTPTPVATHAAAPSTPTKPRVSQDVRINITATGYQKELDECQWVRMDLGAEAPIVGAHTQCGGAVVLTLHPGETVDLTGQGLDGSYVVTDSRDAHAGEDAETALSGMDATVVLQTCYPGSGGHERLVGLEPA